MKLATIALFLLSFLFVQADEHDHAYKVGDEVVAWVNTVGPYHNRQENYAYYSLPFCRGPKMSIGHYHETLGEQLLGVELDFSGLPISFMGISGQLEASVSIPSVSVDQQTSVYCTLYLSTEDETALMHAISGQYWYQMYIDDLPMWGVVGKIVTEGEKKTYQLFTHKKFQIGYNGNRIVEVNMTTDNRVILKHDVPIDLTFEVKWVPSNVLFEDRFDRYLDVDFFQHRIHWFSLFNAFMMVIFLVGLVSLILMRTLRKDYARYEKDGEIDDLERDFGDEYGWKQIHGDVFRPPSHALLFASLVGTGCHIFVVLLVVVIIAMVGEIYIKRGSLLGTIIYTYAALSPVNGYVGGSVFCRFGGRRWIRQMFCGAFLLPCYVFSTAMFINCSAMFLNATRTINGLTMLTLMAICIFVILPLTLVGTVLGRNMSGQSNYPCRVNAVPRPIPEKKWYMEPSALIAIGGILPFGSIFIEVYFVFTSFWAYKVYYVYGFMFLVSILLSIVTMCMTCVCCYVLLNAEDYRWRWTSFFTGASIAFYVFLYSIYYFFVKTKMYGPFQTFFYFAYTLVFCVGLGVMCGTFGFFAASKFVGKIYSSVKID